jgi:hypothetical protein
MSFRPEGELSLELERAWPERAKKSSPVCKAVVLGVEDFSLRSK